MKKIVIVDYGVGNLRSLMRAFEHHDANITISEDPKILLNADSIVLPGDGAFKSGIDGLRIRNLLQPVLKFVQSKKPVLGICLGAQILFSRSFEFGSAGGLDKIKGKIVKFPKLEVDKIPHIGWNSLEKSGDNSWKNTLLNGINPGNEVYYIHSYIMLPEDKSDILAYTTYGGIKFCSVVKSGNIYGCQFHPEKSAAIGLSIIYNFMKLI